LIKLNYHQQTRELSSASNLTDIAQVVRLPYYETVILHVRANSDGLSRHVSCLETVLRHDFS